MNKLIKYRGLPVGQGLLTDQGFQGMGPKGAENDAERSKKGSKNQNSIHHVKYLLKGTKLSILRLGGDKIFEIIGLKIGQIYKLSRLKLFKGD